jgi:hypothetical protein
MTVDDLRSGFGTYRSISKSIGVSPSQLTEWSKRGIPLARQALIEIQTDGKLKADRSQIKKANPMPSNPCS